MSTAHTWQTRMDWAVRVLQWITLAVGVFLGFFQLGPEPRSLAAAAVAGGYVITFQVVPRQLLGRRWVGEVAAVMGVAALAVSIGLTGGLASPYLLLSLTPPFSAAVFFGLRVALETAALSASALVAVVATLQAPVDPVQLTAWGSLYLLMAATVSYGRRILIDEQRAHLEASAETAARLARLEGAHRLLTRLAELAEDAELNPVIVGRMALEDLGDVVPYRAGTIAISGEEGPVVVARTGPAESAWASRTLLPLQAGEREVGLVVLARDEPFDGADHRLIENALQPVALAFANIRLLQEIARKAIREERVRLARELHDEIGPSLASLGLALDLALLQHPAEPGLADHLETLRHSVAGLVEEVRTTVADLRESDQPSLTEVLQALVASAPPDGPEVIVVLDERRPPRPSLASDLAAILTEALRNALRHSAARQVRVEGWIDFDKGVILVRDDGRGFDPDRVPDHRFGLVGMRERARLIGATLELDTGPGQGTRVAVELSP